MKNLLLSWLSVVIIAAVLTTSILFLAQLNIFSGLGGFAIPVVICVSFIVAAILGERVFRFLKGKKRELNHEEVARYIEDFLAGRGANYDWDDFISVPIEDPELDRVRLICGKLPNTHKPAGKVDYCSEEDREALRKILYRLRKA